MGISELTIKDLMFVIGEMDPIKIIIDGITVWDDNIDLTSLSDLEAARCLCKNKEKYWDVVSSSKIVKNISFEIVDYHHSFVSITTE